jgi:hypothetical protein
VNRSGDKQSLSFGYPSLFDPSCVATNGNLSISIACGGLGRDCPGRRVLRETGRDPP